MRNSSPKPGRRLVSSASIASNVLSRLVETGAAGGDDGVDVGDDGLLAHQFGDARRIVFLDRLAGDVVAGGLQLLADRKARGVGVVRASVRHGQHEYAHLGRGNSLVVFTAHRSIIVVAMKRLLPVIALLCLAAIYDERSTTARQGRPRVGRCDDQETVPRAAGRADDLRAVQLYLPE